MRNLKSYRCFAGFVVLALMICAFLLAGCSTPPTEEMNRAQDAVIRAENNADAVVYAAGTIVRAREALARMQGEADSKRYDAARNFAAEALSLAGRAEEEGRIGAQRAREEAAGLIRSVEALLAETESSLRAALLNRELARAVEALGLELESARQLYEEALRNYQSGNFRDAISRAQTVRSLVSDISARLTEMALEVSRKK